MKNQIEMFYVASREIKISSTGTPMIFKRSGPRDDMRVDEKIIEKFMVNRMDAMNFHAPDCQAIRWMRDVMQTNIVTHAEAKCFAMLFCYLLYQKQLTRDYYRRLRSCALWLEENLYQISWVCEKNQISIMCHGKLCPVYPPYKIPSGVPDDIVIIDPNNPKNADQPAVENEVSLVLEQLNPN